MCRYTCSRHMGRKRKVNADADQPERPTKKKKERLTLENNTESEDLFTPPYVIQNVFSTFNLGIEKLDLKALSLQKPFIEYNPHKFAAATLRLRNPKTTALAFGSGNMVCTGAKNEMISRYASRRYVRLLQMQGLPVSFSNFRIQNIVASVNTGHALKLKELSIKYGPYVSYEPDLFPGLVFRTTQPRLVFLCFRSGKIVATGGKNREDLSTTFKLLYHNILKHFFDEKGVSKSSSEYRRSLRDEVTDFDDDDDETGINLENFL